MEIGLIAVLLVLGVIAVDLIKVGLAITHHNQHPQAIRDR